MEEEEEKSHEEREAWIINQLYTLAAGLFCGIVFHLIARRFNVNKDNMGNTAARFANATLR